MTADPAQLASGPGMHDEPEKALQPPSPAPEAESSDDAPPEVLERWNHPRVNMYRFYTTLYSFIVMGMNDGAVGVSARDLESLRDGILTRRGH